MARIVRGTQIAQLGCVYCEYALANIAISGEKL